MSARNLALVLALASCAQPRTPDHGQNEATTRPDMEAVCAGKTEWSDPGPPVAIFGNVYHVGTCTITVLLLTTPDGHVMIDAAPEAAAPVVLANIAKLGFDPQDVKWIVSSHEHWDHSGGLAALKKATGARLAANRAEVQALESGKTYRQDPQTGLVGESVPVTVDRVITDGETLRLGGLTLTMHAIPAHAPGSTSWTWTSCDGTDCKRVAYLDSVSTPAADGYRFSDHPEYVATVRAALGKMGRIPCDILLTPHPGQSNMYARYAGKAPLVDPEACANYARNGLANLEKLLAREAQRGG